jgi:heme exporter protein D
MMQWESLQAFFDMGGYATYVWGSFGTTAVLMIAEVLLLKRRLAALTRDEGDSQA